MAGASAPKPTSVERSSDQTVSPPLQLRRSAAEARPLGPLGRHWGQAHTTATGDSPIVASHQPPGVVMASWGQAPLCLSGRSGCREPKGLARFARCLSPLCPCAPPTPARDWGQAHVPAIGDRHMCRHMRTCADDVTICLSVYCDFLCRVCPHLERPTGIEPSVAVRVLSANACSRFSIWGRHKCIHSTAQPNPQPNRPFPLSATKTSNAGLKAIRDRHGQSHEPHTT